MPADLKAFFNVCDPIKPPPKRNGIDTYVDFGAARATMDAVTLIARQIERDESRSKFFLAGHLGSGKSTELLRLRDRLEAPAVNPGTRRFRVLYVDSERFLDQADAEVPDILLMLAAAIGEGFGPESSFKFGLEYSDDFRKALKGLIKRFTQMELTSAEFSAGFARFVLSLQKSPAARRDVRKALERRESTIVGEINLLIEAVRNRLRQTEDADLVIIVDSLEKIYLRFESASGGTNHQRIFVDGASILRSIDCTMVLSIPISLVYSSDRARMENTVGTSIFTLPMVKIRERNGRPFPEGIHRLRTAIQARAEIAGASLDDLFDGEKTIIDICEFSGGHIRSLMRLLRTASAFVESAPITGEAVDLARQQAANAFSTSIREEDFDRLAEVHRTKSIENSPDYQRLLYEMCIFEYLNGGEPWHDVNPAVATLSKFQKRIGKSSAEDPDAGDRPH